MYYRGVDCHLPYSCSQDRSRLPNATKFLRVRDYILRTLRSGHHTNFEIWLSCSKSDYSRSCEPGDSKYVCVHLHINQFAHTLLPPSKEGALIKWRDNVTIGASESPALCSVPETMLPSRQEGRHSEVKSVRFGGPRGAGWAVLWLDGIPTHRRCDEELTNTRSSLRATEQRHDAGVRCIDYYRVSWRLRIRVQWAQKRGRIERRSWHAPYRLSMPALSSVRILLCRRGGEIDVFSYLGDLRAPTWEASIRSYMVAIALNLQYSSTRPQGDGRTYRVISSWLTHCRNSSRSHLLQVSTCGPTLGSRQFR